MILSMTGYGKSQFENDEITISAEIKTLNSKYLDASIKLPRTLSAYEIETRNLLSESLTRGKVSLSVEIADKRATAEGGQINRELLKAYFTTYQQIASELNEAPPDLFRLAAQSPDVIQNKTLEDVDPETWALVRSCIKEAAKHCNDFRQQEGDALEKDFKHNIDQISETLALIQKQVPERNANFRERLQSQLNELPKDTIDENRFEQEMIYYLEKLDINEEIVRLSNHLSFFKKVLAEPYSSGKKLGFISQEIGREINTIGAKANDAVIQHHVVRMKEELEKIKEQVLNIL
uniref:YicC family protein n=1 Tax=Roseihalotalea indica TaxID=2867963 RepID=A0AA49PZ32_9BACT|nr:YicC family protein [Tunicatimonas sp. TK19036]